MLKKLKSYLTHPLVRDIDIDSPVITMRHKRIIHEKLFLKKNYNRWYKLIASSLLDDIKGPVLEIGSGGGFLKKFIPNLITSEVFRVNDIDIVLDGKSLPFKKAFLKGIVMCDVFHHIPNIKSFLDEASYCIKPGGSIVMLEPWVTAWSRLIYNHLHHEPFDTGTKQWHFKNGKPLSVSNQALPWIVFDRDRTFFKKQYPEWQIDKIILHTPFCYLLSGGVSHKNFMPGFLFEMCRTVEDIMQPFMQFLAMFALIRLTRKDI